MNEDKPPGTRRVVGIGDSVMFGWGVETEESYMGILDDKLRRWTPSIQVLNLATPGYNTVMEVARLVNKGLMFDPDLILVHVVNNDFDLPRFLLEPRNVWSLDRCYLVDLIRGASDAGDEGRWLQPRDLPDLSDDERQRVSDRFRFLVGEEAFAGALADLGAICEDRGIQALVIVQSCKGDMWSEVCRIADKHGIPILRTGPILSKYLVKSEQPNNREGWIKTFWLSRSDPHPNSLAHRLYAKAILEWLNESSLLLQDVGRIDDNIPSSNHLD